MLSPAGIYLRWAGPLLGNDRSHKDSRRTQQENALLVSKGGRRGVPALREG